MRNWDYSNVSKLATAYVGVFTVLIGSAFGKPVSVKIEEQRRSGRKLNVEYCTPDTVDSGLKIMEKVFRFAEIGQVDENGCIEINGKILCGEEAATIENGTVKRVDLGSGEVVSEEDVSTKASANNVIAAVVAKRKPKPSKDSAAAAAVDAPAVTEAKTNASNVPATVATEVTKNDNQEATNVTSVAQTSKNSPQLSKTNSNKNSNPENDEDEGVYAHVITDDYKIVRMNVDTGDVKAIQIDPRLQDLLKTAKFSADGTKILLDANSANLDLSDFGITGSDTSPALDLDALFDEAAANSGSSSASSGYSSTSASSSSHLSGTSASSGGFVMPTPIAGLFPQSSDSNFGPLPPTKANDNQTNQDKNESEAVFPFYPQNGAWYIGAGDSKSRVVAAGAAYRSDGMAIPTKNQSSSQDAKIALEINRLENAPLGSGDERSLYTQNAQNRMDNSLRSAALQDAISSKLPTPSEPSADVRSARLYSMTKRMVADLTDSLNVNHSTGAAAVKVRAPKSNKQSHLTDTHLVGPGPDKYKVVTLQQIAHARKLEGQKSFGQEQQQQILAQTSTQRGMGARDILGIVLLTVAAVGGLAGYRRMR